MRTALLIALVIAVPGRAETLRPMATLTDSVVRLSDLFDGADARVLGPAPALGGRIVVEAAQLDAIARQFGVAWHPASPADRAVLDRPGQTLPRETVMDALRLALTTAGVPPESEIELPGFAAPLVADAGRARPEVANVSLDPETGRFTALLSVTCLGAEPINMRLSGRAIETADIVVPTHRVLAGDVIGAGDLRSTRIRASLITVAVARTAAQAQGMAIRHLTLAGQPIALADLVRPTLVHRGQTVLMLLDSPGIQLTAEGRALDDAAAGENVRIQNPGSKAVVEGQVMPDGSVRVSPAGTPARVALR